MIFAVLGDANIRKQSFIFSMARELAAVKKSVVIVDLDPCSPVGEYLADEEVALSVGEVVTSTELTQELVLKSLLKTSSERICLSCYRTGDFSLKYPKIHRSQVSDFLTHLSPLADYVLININGDISISEGYKAVIQAASGVILVVDDSLYSIGVYYSLLEQINAEYRVVAIGKRDLIERALRSADVYLEYSSEMLSISSSKEALTANEFGKRDKKCLVHLRAFLQELTGENFVVKGLRQKKASADRVKTEDGVKKENAGKNERRLGKIFEIPRRTTGFRAGLKNMLKKLSKRGEY
ncbi:hypothetical protein [Bacteroides heparinolyticus]|uniref:hypothetical protein n=1 Tax=Prevotella heparinolytica TaxID=28113 RepID=UPI00359FA8DF